MKITILVDNHAGEGLIAEHGLSLWIEVEGRHILFDTGQGRALEPNARALGVDLGKTDYLVLSHGHYDHTGGISTVLRLARSVDIYCHPGAVQPRHSLRDGIARPIQMPDESLAAVDALPAHRLHWVQRPMLLFEGVGVSGPIPRETSYESMSGPFYLDPEGKREDRHDDEIALWIRTSRGVVVCTGCCHAGLVNTLNHVYRLNGGMRIRAAIGGFHLLDADRSRLDKTTAALLLIDPDAVIPCHCTGDAATAALERALGDRVSPGAGGAAYRF